jgi:trehalose 6-phosphate synthase
MAELEDQTALGVLRRMKNSGVSRTIRLTAIYGAIAVAVVLIVLRVVVPLASSLIQQWARHDVELRSRLVFNFLYPNITSMAAAGQDSAIVELFERVAQDERILGVGFCDDVGRLKFTTKLMPAGFSCKKVARSETRTSSSLILGGREMFAAAFPVSTPQLKGHLIVLNDLSYAEERGAAAREYLSLILGGIILVSAALATLMALVMTRRWLSTLRQSLTRATIAGSFAGDEFDHSPLGAELQQALRRLSPARPEFDADHTSWSAETLRQVIANELPDTEIIVASNREPYIHNYVDEQIELQTPASGLVSAIEPIMRACGGVWIAHGSGSADKDVVDDQDRLEVPPHKPSYTLRRIWISEEEQEGYYYGLSNEGLWPLCHIAFVRPNFRQSDWEAYQTVNQRFADTIVGEARGKSPIVLIQDYHLALVPRMVREQLPEATIIFFWHIPWPNAEAFGICPWKEEILKGMLGSSILGFHTRFHCNNFFDTIDRYVESRIDREYASVTYGGRETLVRPFPISIAWPPPALEGQKTVTECRNEVRARFQLPEGTRLAVGVERFDYTKGILDRLWGVDSFLTAYPEWKGRFVFVQVAAPTRSKLPAYRGLQEEAIRLADEINAKHGSDGPRPVELVIRHHESVEVFKLFRAADICIVSSLHDGMNLVAKEFVAARDDNQGVLLLSSFAGASRELSEALIINPYDAHDTSAAIHRALTMSLDEQHERMRLMREQVHGHNVYRWAGQMLFEASKLRKKQRILHIAAQEKARFWRNGR